MENFAFLIIGIFIIVIGIVNMAGNISTIHSYNRKKVKEEDVPAYGKVVGLGTILVGAGLLAKIGLEMLSFAAAGLYVMIAFFVIGLVLILYAQFKYNKGIF